MESRSPGAILRHFGTGSPIRPCPTSAAAGLRQQNVRTNNFVIVRNRNVGTTANPVYGVYLDSKEVTYPGDLTHCTKCHFANNPSTGPAVNVSGATVQSYKADLVDSPLAAKCGSCHDTQAEVGHFISTGGADIKNTRSTAELTPPTLAPSFEVLGP